MGETNAKQKEEARRKAEAYFAAAGYPVQETRCPEVQAFLPFTPEIEEAGKAGEERKEYQAFLRWRFESQKAEKYR